MPPSRRRTETRSVATVGTLEQFGPLGADNRRRQLGRSEDMRVSGKRRVTLVYAGASRAESKGPSLGEALAQSMVVTCSKSLKPTQAQQNANPGNLRARIEGVVRFGNDGHAMEARFDWVQGTVVTVVAAFIEVIAELVDELNGDAPNSNVKAGAFVGYGTHDRSAQLTRYEVTDDEAAVATFEVPDLAREFSLWWSGASCVVNFYSGTVLLYTSLSLTVGQKGIALALPGGVTHVEVNGSSFGPNLIVWHLDV